MEEDDERQPVVVAASVAVRPKMHIVFDTSSDSGSDKVRHRPTGDDDDDDDNGDDEMDEGEDDVVEESEDDGEVVQSVHTLAEETSR